MKSNKTVLRWITATATALYAAILLTMLSPQIVLAASGVSPSSLPPDPSSSAPASSSSAPAPSSSSSASSSSSPSSSSKPASSSSSSSSKPVSSSSTSSKPSSSSSASSKSSPSSSASSASGSETSDISGSGSLSGSDSSVSASVSGDSSASSSAVDTTPEVSIHIPEGQTLVLGEEGKFLLRTDGGSTDPIPDAEWDTPAGYYDANTDIQGFGEMAYIRSVTPATTERLMAKGLVFVPGSDITVKTQYSIAIDATDITIGSPDTNIPTKISAIGSDVGINLHKHCTVGQGAVLAVSGDLNGISSVDSTTPLGDYNLRLLAQSQLIATANNSVAVFVDMLEMQGASLTATSNSEGGVWALQSITLEASGSIRSSLTATSADRNAIYCDSLYVSGSDVSGKTDNGDAGIYAKSFIAAYGDSQSTIRGQANSGYGIVALNLTGDETDFPDGSIYITSPAGCVIEGTVADGVGLCTNYFNVFDGSDSQLRIVGTAGSGTGIAANNFSVPEGNNNYYIEGSSSGASASHFQPDANAPSCAGMDINNSNMSGSGTILAKAPKSVAGSFGIYSISNDGEGSGDLILSGDSGQHPSLTAVGETGIRADSLALYGATSIDANGAVNGIDISSFSVMQVTGPNQVTTTGDTGIGLKLDNSYDDYLSVLILNSTVLTATGAEYGIYAVADSVVYISDHSTIVANAVGGQGKAGFFCANRTPENMSYVQLQDSNIDASGPLYGLCVKDFILEVSAPNYSLDVPGHLTGTGSESGIYIDFKDPQGNYVGLTTQDMKLPDGTYYTITGISAGVEPDEVGRKAAIELSGSSIDGGAVIAEEYSLPAKGSLSGTPYAVYALNMNIEDYTQYAWASPELQLEAQKDGLIATGNGALGASITAERTSADDANKIHLLNGTHKVHLTADANIATVQFNANGGVPAPADQKVGIGGYVTQPPEMKKDGFAFAGWFEADTQHKWDFTVDTVQSSLLKLEARWDAETYTLTFEGNADGDPSLSGMPKDNPLQLSAGALIPKPKETPTRTGMQFQFWADDPKGTTPWNFDDTPMPAKDMSLYAIWKAQVYEVVYDSMGGTPPTQKEEVPYQEKVPGKIQTPTRDNYKFEGWFLDKETTQPWDKDTPMPDHNITLYAKWSRTNAVLSFDANGGDAKSAPPSQKVAPGSPVNIADYQPGGNYAPLFSGHFFLGWLDPAGKVVADTFDMPDNNLQLKAQWREAPKPELPQYIVVYQNTKKPADIEKELHYVYEYTDLLGRAQQLQPHYQWDTGVLAAGGTTDITIDFWSGNSRTSGLRSTVKLYVLHETQLLTKEDTATFAFGASISKDGSEWHPSCAEEVPDFTSGTIKTRNLPIVFRLNGTDMRTAGTYHPEFDVTYTDYFGTVHQLKKEVTAIVLSKDTPVSSSSSSISSISSSTSSSPTSRSSSSSSPPASRTSSQPTPPIDSLAPASQLPLPPSQTNDAILQELEEAGDPILQLGNTKVPLFAQGQTQVWGLMNLLLLLLSLAGWILLAVYAWRHRLYALLKGARKDKAVFALSLLSLLAMPVMLLLFLLTQNLHYLMVIFDKRTPVMLLIAVLQLAAGLAVFLWTRSSASDANKSNADI